MFWEMAISLTLLGVGAAYLYFKNRQSTGRGNYIPPTLPTIPPVVDNPIDIIDDELDPTTFPVDNTPPSTPVWQNLYLIEKVPSYINRATFGVKVIEISQRLAINPNWLMAVMHFESRFNPKAKNPYGSATGLIQFIEGTARDLGTSTAALYNMSAIDQLYYVERYLRQYKPYLRDFVSVYLSVFYPKAIVQNWSYNRAFAQSIADVNPIFVKNGVLTINTIRAELLNRYPLAEMNFNYPV